ncbi:MAG: ATP phosphoribosyltransferase [Flavobacteriaceae bacterium]|jgi:ATP phosphoribosyltransferase|nr:ATP phosphoribosyltransferase [Flavobacteriaceae bacterium]
MNEKLKIAVQKSGRLSEKSLEIFRECGIKIPNSSQKLRTVSSNFPVEILFLRDDDIPQYVEQNVADIGILGENEVWEKNRNVHVVRKLGFGDCRLSLAVPKDENYTGLNYLNHKKIATSYPRILNEFCRKNQLEVEIEEISGSVEIAPSIGLANCIFDIVSSGSTLLTNGLKEVETVAQSEAVLIKSPDLSEEKQEILNRLLFRIQAVMRSRENKYILLNAPNHAVSQIISILPGMKSPTVLPLAQEGWSSIHSVITEERFWEIIDELKALGAQGILIIPIEKMIV